MTRHRHAVCVWFSIISLMSRLNCALYAAPPATNLKCPSADLHLLPRLIFGLLPHVAPVVIFVTPTRAILLDFILRSPFRIRRMSGKENNLFVWNNLVCLYQGAPANVYLTGVFSGIVSCHTSGRLRQDFHMPAARCRSQKDGAFSPCFSDLANLDYNVKLVFRRSLPLRIYRVRH